MGSVSYFNNVASKWDQMREGFFSSRIREVALGVAGIENGHLAADLGAGTGFMTEALVAAGAKVIAVDQSKNMLDQLCKKFAASAKVESRLGGAMKLPVADGNLDRVFANMYLHHVDDPLRSIVEMKRILKPGGRLVITDLEKHNFEFFRQEHHDRWMGFYRSDIRHWLSTAGFSNIIVSTVPNEQCCASSNCAAEEASVGIFLATATA